MPLDPDDIKYLDGKFDKVHSRIDEVQADVQKINGRLIRQETSSEEMGRRVNAMDEAFDHHVNEEGNRGVCPNLQTHLNRNHTFGATMKLLGTISTGIGAGGTIAYCLYLLLRGVML